MRSHKILNLLLVITLAFSFFWQAGAPVAFAQAAASHLQPGTPPQAQTPAAPSKGPAPTPAPPGNPPRDPHQNIPDAEMDLETETETPSLSAFTSAEAVTAAPEQPSLISPSNGASGVSTTPDLKVNVTDPDGSNLDVTFYGRVAQSGSQSSPGPNFTIVALPDTQNYTGSSSRAQIFNSQTQWIATNRESQNIVYVAHLGDMVNDADKIESEWQFADKAMSFLEDPSTTGLPEGIPYGAAIGNNDTNTVGVATLYNKYFGISRFSGRSYYGGSYLETNNDNHYSLFSASGMDFITMYFEYDSSPETAILNWADNLLKKYSNRRAIVVTHHVIGSGNPGAFSTQGLAIYNTLKANPNLFLMLGGHISNEGQRQDTYNGNTVYSLLSDYQNRTNGGNGWLRIMEFQPANNQIQVKTYSPYLNQYEIDANSQFSLSYPMTSSGFVNLGKVRGVTSGSEVSLTWPDLATQTQYEWYVTVSDGSQETTGPTWSFTTGTNQKPTDITLSPSTIDENLPVETSVGTLMATDPDPGDSFTYSLVSGVGDYASFSIQGNTLLVNASFDYETKNSYPIRVRATDSGGLNLDKDLTVGVNDVNENPAVNADTYHTFQAQSLAVGAPGVLANDTDPENNSLTANLVSGPANGTLNLQPDGSFTYTPNAGFIGTDTFTYTASDGMLTSITALVSISVAPVTDCYSLTLSHTGQGSDPTASPTNSLGCAAGQFMAGEVVSLSGANPAAGWQINGWSGTANDASMASANSLTMPAGDHSVSVNYTQPEYTLTVNIIGSGTVTKGPDKASYLSGEQVTLTASPAAGWNFGGWSGDLAGSTNPAVITMDGNKTVTGNFISTSAEVKHEETRTGGSTGSATVSTSTSLTGVSGNLYLAAISSRNMAPVSSVNGLGLTWMKVRAQCAGRNQTGMEVWMAQGSPSGNGVVTANFASPPSYAAIAISRYSGVPATQPIGNLVSGNTNGISGACSGGTDSASYSFNLTTTASGSVVYGAATMRGKSHTPGAGYSEWAEYIQGSSASVAVEDKMVASPSTVAVNGTFSGSVDWAMVGIEILPGGATPPQKYTLTTNISGQGSVNLSPSGGSYDPGASVQITAVPASGWSFSGWSGDLSGSPNPAAITMDSNKTVTATFVQIHPDQYSLTINTIGQGSVTFDPPGGVYNSGTSVQLTAAPASGWSFTGWSGHLAGSTNPAILTMDGNKTVTATFSSSPPAEVKHEETRTGGSSSSATVSTSTSLTGVSGNLYLAAISSRNMAPVSSVNGLGLTWTKVRAQCAGRNQTGMEVWKAQGNPSGDGVVTANFAKAPSYAAIAVSRYSGASLVSPIGNVISGNTNGASGACSGGKDSASYSFNLTTTASGSVVYGAATMRGKSLTPGTGYTERGEYIQAGYVSVAVEDKTFASPSTVAVSGTFSGSVDWAMIGIEILPSTP